MGLYYGSSESSFKPKEQIVKEHEVVVFPDKKIPKVDYPRITEHIKEGDAIRREMDVGQDEATWHIPLERPDRPAAVIWMTDIHYGNSGVDYNLLDKHLDLVDKTPNMYAFIGGDTIDNFSAAKHPQAATSDVVPPQIQAQGFMERLRELDKKKKIGAFVFGNHEAFTSMVGLDYWNLFMQGLNAPVFSRTGMLKVKAQDQDYKVALGHKHWGVSKINPENAAKRALSYSFPEADAVLLGDDHQSAISDFTYGKRKVIAGTGGTYKLFDPTGLRWGFDHPGRPGYTLLFWSNRKHMEFTHDPDTAQELLK